MVSDTDTQFYSNWPATTTVQFVNEMSRVLKKCITYWYVTRYLVDNYVGFIRRLSAVSDEGGHYLWIRDSQNRSSKSAGPFIISWNIMECVLINGTQM